MPEDKLKILHSNLLKEGYDLPDYDVFASDMQDKANLNKLHSNLVKEGYDLPDLDTFTQDMGLKKKDTFSTDYASYDVDEEVLTEEQKLIIKSQEPQKDPSRFLSTEQKKQALQSEYKEKGIDVDALTEEDVYPQEIGLKEFYTSGTKRNAYLSKERLNLEEDFQEQSQSLLSEVKEKYDFTKEEDVKKAQEEYEAGIDKLADEYANKWDEISDAGTGLFIGEGQTVDDMIKSFNVLAPEDASVIKDEIDSIMDTHGLSSEGKIQDLNNLADYFVDKVPEESKKKLRGEINALIARETMFSGSRLSPFAAKQQASIMQEDIEEKKQPILEEWAKLENKKGLSKEEKEKKNELSRQIRMISQAERLVDKIQELPDDDGSFWAGLAAPWKDGTVQSLGITDVIDAAMQLQASKRAGELRDTAADRMVLNALGLYQIGQQDIGDWHRRGEMISEMIPFMAQFALTAGIPGVGSATAKKATGEALKKILKEQAEKTAARKGAEWVGRTVRGAAIRTPLLTITHQRVLEGLRGEPEFNPDTGTFTIDQESREGLLEAVAKGGATGFTEAVFEQGGEAIGKGVNAMLRRMGVKPPMSAPWLRQVKDRVAFNGWIGEYLEELPTEFFQGLIEEGSFEAAWNQLAESNKDIFWVTAIVSGVFGGVTGAVSIGQTKRQQKAYRVLGEDAFTKIEEAARKGDRANLIRVQQEVWKSLPEEKRTKENGELIVKLTGQALYDVAAEQGQSGLREGLNDEFKKEGAEPIQGELAFEEEQAPTTEETTGVQEEPKVGEETVQKTEQPVQETEGTTERGQEEIVDEQISPQPEKETEEVRVQPEDVTVTETSRKETTKLNKALGKEITTNDITLKGEKVGDVSTGLMEDGNIRMNNIQLSEEAQGQGIGTEVYRNINRQAQERGGVLISSETMSEQAEGVWKKLVKEGEAVREGDIYKFKPIEDEIKKEEGLQEEAQEEVKQPQRTRVRQEILESGSEVTEEQTDAAMTIFDAQAKVWAETLGKTTEEYYETLDVKGEVAASQQAKQAQKKGRTIKGEFRPLRGKNIVTLFKKGDVSTLLHEIAGHRGRRLLSELAAADKAWGAKMSEVEKWANVKDGKWTTAKEEKFAKAFEGYVKDGVLPKNAPQALRDVFDKLSQWLKNIYQDPNVFEQLPDNIRSTFDSMLGVTPVEKEGKPEEQKPKEGDVTSLFQEEPTGKDIEKMRNKTYEMKKSDVLKDNPDLKGKELQEAIEKKWLEGVPKDKVEAAREWLRGNKDFRALIEKPQPIISEETGETTTEKKESSTEPKTKARGKKPRGVARGEYKEKGKTKTGSMVADQTEEQRVVKGIIEANRPMFESEYMSETIDKAKEFIDDNGIANATIILSGRTLMTSHAVGQAARQILMSYYSKILADKSKSESDKKAAHINLDNIFKVLAEEATDYGRAGNILKAWKIFQPQGLLEYITRLNETYNEERLKNSKGFNEDVDLYKSLAEAYETLSDGSKAVLDKLLAEGDLDKALRRMRPKPIPVKIKKKSVSRDVMKQAKIRKSNAIKLLKAANKGDLPTVLYQEEGEGRLSDAQVYAATELLKAYEEMGYIDIKDVEQSLKDDFKRAGTKLSNEQAEFLLGQKNAEKGKSWKQVFMDEQARIATRRGLKDMNVRVDEVIKEHWTVKDATGRDLKQKLVDEAGLSQGDAAYLSKRIEEEYNKLLEKEAKEKLRKTFGLDKEDLPPKEKKAKESALERMMGLLNMGAMEEKEFRIAFADEFGLAAPPTQEQAERILELSTQLQKLGDMGEFRDEVAAELGRYIYELYPQTRFGEVFGGWFGLAYASMLSGPFTHLLNLFSAGSNMVLMPFKKASNLTLFADALKGKIKKGKKLDVYNPFTTMLMFSAFYGAGYGVTAFRNAMATGNVNNKWMQSVMKRKGTFRVMELERDKYGKGMRFKPMVLQVGDKIITIKNPAEFAKYVTRTLAAEDAFMFNTFFEVEIFNTLRTKLRDITKEEGKELTGAKLTERLLYEYNEARIGDRATEIDKEVEEEYQEYLEITGKTLSEQRANVIKRIRKRQKMLEALKMTPEEIQQAERLARGNIFTDERHGIVSKFTRLLQSAMMEHKVGAILITPWVPFTKVLANVTEYMLDSVPFYGFARAEGLSVSSIYRRITIDHSNRDPLSAVMGEKGTETEREYYEQMSRAWFGTLAFIGFALASAGNDEDDWIQISGNYTQDKRKRIYGQENVMPANTIRIGNFYWSYLNFPLIAGPLALIGNMNDRWSDINKDIDHYEIRVALAGLQAFGDTFMMMKETSIGQGVGEMMDLFAMAMNPDTQGGWGERLYKTVLERYGGFIANPLPTNINLVRQIEKLLDPKSYTRKEIEDMAMYVMGLERINNEVSIDQLGNEVKFYPGESFIPYTYWFKLKGKEAKDPEIRETAELWEFMFKYNVAPTRINNFERINIETPPGSDEKRYKRFSGIETRPLFQDEITAYTKLAGKYFAERLTDFIERTPQEKIDAMNDEKIVLSKTIRGKDQKVETKLQQVVRDIKNDARADARTALFYWGEVKKDYPKVWEDIRKYELYKPYAPSAKDFEGNPVDKDVLYQINSEATRQYAEMMKDILSDKGEMKKHMEKHEKGETSDIDTVSDLLWSAAKEVATGMVLSGQ